MIHVDRSQVPVPEVLNPSNPVYSDEMSRLYEFYNNQERHGNQHRYHFKIHLHSSVKSTLEELFHGKCAYCESSVAHVAAMDIEHFRPKSSVVESPDHPGYWWLAYDWNNILVACANCNRKTRSKEGVFGKMNHFPLEDESKRAFSPDSPLSDESPLLLDPCSDLPENHFTYNDEGWIMASTDKGKTTILVLGLNRPDLVRRRKTVVTDVNIHFKLLFQTLQIDSALTSSAAVQTIDYLKTLTEENQEFAGLKRQLIREFFESIDKDLAKYQNLSQTKVFTKKRKREIKKEYKDYVQKVSNVTFEDASVLSTMYKIQERYVERIQLENIRTFEKQSFDFMESEGNAAPWLMLLGQNGTGKSSILKALCLNLCDLEYFQKMVQNELVDPNSFIRHGKRKASIKVWIQGNAKPRILELKKNQVKFINPDQESITIKLPIQTNDIENKVWHAPNYLLAYGATRLLPRGTSHEAPYIASEHSRLDNLFNPFVPLLDAEAWLLSLNKVQYRRVILIIKDLLQIPDDQEINPVRKKIMIPVNGNLIAINELSDGYQSLIALVSDILQLVTQKWMNPDEARGIVLIDELGAHLHPRWRLRVVKSLRNALPNIQFVISSHDPLCLRGLSHGEVNVLVRSESNVIQNLDSELLPDHSAMTIEQLLTSDLFGLINVMDEEIEKTYEEYYSLLSKKEEDKTEDDKAKIKDLTEKLSKKENLGSTPIEQSYYKIISQTAAKKLRDDGFKLKENLKSETVKEVKEILSTKKLDWL